MHDGEAKIRFTPPWHDNSWSKNGHCALYATICSKKVKIIRNIYINTENISINCVAGTDFKVGGLTLLSKLRTWIEYIIAWNRDRLARQLNIVPVQACFFLKWTFLNFFYLMTNWSCQNGFISSNWTSFPIQRPAFTSTEARTEHTGLSW